MCECTTAITGTGCLTSSDIACSESDGCEIGQVQEVCKLVAVRGARLTGAATAGILRHLGCDDKAHEAKRNVVAVEGAVMRNYDLYR